MTCRLTSGNVSSKNFLETRAQQSQLQLDLYDVVQYTATGVRVNPDNALRTFKLHTAMLSNDAADPPHKHSYSIARNC